MFSGFGLRVSRTVRVYPESSALKEGLSFWVFCMYFRDTPENTSVFRRGFAIPRDIQAAKNQCVCLADLLKNQCAPLRRSGAGERLEMLTRKL